MPHFPGDIIPFGSNVFCFLEVSIHSHCAARGNTNLGGLEESLVRVVVTFKEVSVLVCVIRVRTLRSYRGRDTRVKSVVQLTHEVDMRAVSRILFLPSKLVKLGSNFRRGLPLFLVCLLVRKDVDEDHLALVNEEIDKVVHLVRITDLACEGG